MSDTPETDELRGLFENHEHRANMGDVYELCESLERQRDAYAETLREILAMDPDWTVIAKRHPELASGSGEGSSTESP